MKVHVITGAVVALAILCSMNEAFGFDSELFAEVTPASRDITVLGLGSGVSDLHGIEIHNMLDETETSISIDLLSTMENPAAWGVFGADLKLVLEKDYEWTVLDATAGRRVDGNRPAPTWDAASWIDRVLDSGLTNSNMDFTGYPVLRGLDGGLNNVYVDNIIAIPEPATYGLITIFGGGLLLFRRRFKV